MLSGAVLLEIYLAVFRGKMMEYVKKLVKGDYHGCTECCQVLCFQRENDGIC